METELKAKEIFEYLQGYLFNDLKISKEQEKEYIKELCFMLENN